MLQSLNNLFSRYYDNKVDGTGLAVFRIFYSLVLLCEISQLYFFRHLIFDPVPFLIPSEIQFSIPIAIWFVAVLFLLFGFKTRLASFINYLMGLILVGSINSFEYHVFYAYMGINFFLIFIPVSQCLSMDRFIDKLKFISPNFGYQPTKDVRQIYYFILPLVGVGFVYFDSVFYKMASPMWLKGLGSWHPSSLPMCAQSNLSFLLNHEFLVRGIGWFTNIFEALFLFLFFRKKMRVLIFTLGMILHVGILIQFPIPWFALTLIALYIPLIPLSFWRIFNFKKSRNHTITFIYDAECPLCIRTKIILQNIDWLGKVKFTSAQVVHKENLKNINDLSFETLTTDIHTIDIKGKINSGLDSYIQISRRIILLFPFYLLLSIPPINSIGKRVYNYIAKNRYTKRCTFENCEVEYLSSVKGNSQLKLFRNFSSDDLKKWSLKILLLTLTIVQFSFLYNTWLIKDIKESTGFSNTKVSKLIEKGINLYFSPMKIFFGITNHPVFSESIHFNGYNHIIAVVYLDKNGREIWLPIIDKKGMPDYYIYGSNWVNWTFRVNGINVDQQVLNNGLTRYTAFWSGINGVDLNNAEFLIKVKKIETPKDWEYNFLNKQISKPWIDAGKVSWVNYTLKSDLKVIEKL